VKKVLVKSKSKITWLLKKMKHQVYNTSEGVAHLWRCWRWWTSYITISTYRKREVNKNLSVQKIFAVHVT